MTSLDAITLLFACQLAGEALHRFAHIPLPGSILGMGLLLLVLALRPRERTALEKTTSWLTSHLSIMFLPMAVGLIDQGEALKNYGIGLAAATAFSTVLAMLAAVAVFRLAARRMEAKKK